MNYDIFCVHIIRLYFEINLFFSHIEFFFNVVFVLVFEG
ncbi:MAG: hypothetical protein ACOYKI_06815 [Sediminibacterium sp.]